MISTRRFGEEDVPVIIIVIRLWSGQLVGCGMQWEEVLGEGIGKAGFPMRGEGRGFIHGNEAVGGKLPPLHQPRNAILYIQMHATHHANHKTYTFCISM